MNVLALSAYVRNKVYIFGSYVPSTKRYLAKESTFFPSSGNKLRDMVSELASLITFAHNTSQKPTQMLSLRVR